MNPNETSQQAFTPAPNVPPEDSTPVGGPTPPEKSAMGPAIGIIIIIIILIVGAFYFWNTSLRETPSPAPEQQGEAGDRVTEGLKQVRTGDEISDIEADLGGTNLEELDNELNAIESQL